MSHTLRFSLPVIICCLIAAPGSGLSQENPRSSSFNWPAPTRIKISDSAVKDGNSAEMTYELDFRQADGGNFAAKLMNCQFLKINGSDVTVEMTAALKPAMEAMNAIPSFVIDPSGRLVDIQGLDALADAGGKMIDQYRQQGAGDDVARTLKTGQASELLKRALSEYWMCWVEAWIDFPALPGKVVSEEFEEPLLLGTTPVKGMRKYSHLGEISGPPSLLHFRIEASIQDPSLTKAVKEMITNIDKTNQRPPATDLDAIPTMTVNTLVEAKIDPATLRPVWAKRSKVIRANSDDPKYDGVKRVETHEYTFHWE